jgi:hypothetical protein
LCSGSPLSAINLSPRGKDQSAQLPGYPQLAFDLDSSFVRYR